MNRLWLVAGILAMSGCTSGPRPFDGTLGYQTVEQPEGLQVTYIDEARASRQAILEQVAQVCADSSGREVQIAQLRVVEESVYDDQVAMTIPIPVGTTATGDTSGWSGTPIESTVHQETVLQRITLRRIVALCPGFA